MLPFCRKEGVGGRARRPTAARKQQQQPPRPKIVTFFCHYLSKAHLFFVAGQKKEEEILEAALFRRLRPLHGGGEGAACCCAFLLSACGAALQMAARHPLPCRPRQRRQLPAASALAAAADRSHTCNTSRRRNPRRRGSRSEFSPPAGRWTLEVVIPPFCSSPRRSIRRLQAIAEPLPTP